MQKLENAVVDAMRQPDLSAAFNLLRTLIMLDRRRAWWAVFRVAEAQSPDFKRRAMISLVGKAYIARRKGLLVGVDDNLVLRSLLRVADADNPQRDWIALVEEERLLLERWLPRRLSRTLLVTPNL
jgi:hypothetical protein